METFRFPSQRKEVEVYNIRLFTLYLEGVCFGKSIVQRQLFQATVILCQQTIHKNENRLHHQGTDPVNESAEKNEEDKPKEIAAICKPSQIHVTISRIVEIIFCFDIKCFKRVKQTENGVIHPNRKSNAQMHKQRNLKLGNRVVQAGKESLVLGCDLLEQEFFLDINGYQCFYDGIDDG